MADKVLDTQGLKCPLPILKTKKALKDMAPGATLEVLTTDPASVIDFPAFCYTSGNALISQSQDGDVFRFVIRHGG